MKTHVRYAGVELVLAFVLMIAAWVAPALSAPAPITIWASTGPEGEALKKSAEVYTKNTGRPVNVVLQARPTYRDKLQTALIGGSKEPDAALIISRDLVPYAEGG